MHTLSLPLHLAQSNPFFFDSSLVGLYQFLSRVFCFLAHKSLVFWAGSARRLVALFVDTLNWLHGRGNRHDLWLPGSCSIGLQFLQFMSSRMVFCMRGFCPP